MSWGFVLMLFSLSPAMTSGSEGRGTGISNLLWLLENPRADEVIMEGSWYTCLRATERHCGMIISVLWKDFSFASLRTRFYFSSGVLLHSKTEQNILGFPTYPHGPHAKPPPLTTSPTQVLHLLQFMNLHWLHHNQPKSTVHLKVHFFFFPQRKFNFFILFLKIWFLKKLLILYWSTVDEQCCVNFRCMSDREREICGI